MKVRELTAMGDRQKDRLLQQKENQDGCKILKNSSGSGETGWCRIQAEWRSKL